MAEKLRILVIDDEQIVLDSVLKYLRKYPFVITTSSDPGEALELINQTGFDIILTDLMMPKIDGFELIRRVKNILPKTPVIMMTGYATISTAEQAIQTGAFGYIAKPFSGAELKDALRLAVDYIEKSS